MADLDLKKFGLEGAKADPDFNDFGLLTASEQLVEKAQAQADKPESAQPQIQEQFSNPSQWPGFENLSQKEKQQRLALSQFDPANQTSTGGFVPPGTYEHPATRAAASFLPTLAAPEVNSLRSAAGRNLIDPLLNAVSRIGTGTLGNVAYESPNIKNKEDLLHLGKESLKLNSFLEAPFLGIKALRGAAEIYNPGLRFAEQKAGQIQNEYNAARALQKETYRPVFEKYGETNVLPVANEEAKIVRQKSPILNNSGNPFTTHKMIPATSEKITPTNYLKNLGIKKGKLYTEAKKQYQAFLDNPTFQNLHNLQSQLGYDLRAVQRAGNKPKTTQVFTDYRNALQNEAKDFLKADENALNAYNLGSDITRNLVVPFEANPPLRQISLGTKLDVTPQQINNAIKRGKEKIIGQGKNNVFTAIPEGHSLNNHYEDISNALSRSEGLQALTPEMVKKFIPNVPGIIQNPNLNNIFTRYGSPGYKLGSRALTDYLTQKKFKQKE